MASLSTNHDSLLITKIVLVLFVLGMVVLKLQMATPVEGATKALKGLPTHSTTIDLSSNGSLLVNVNTDANSVTVFQVQGPDNLQKLAEIPVGREPHSVAVRVRNVSSDEAFVTNAQSGTVSIVNLQQLKVVGEIQVGTEPRGCAMTPNGSLLFVANHTSGTVSVINTQSRSVINTINVGGNPFAIAVSDDGDFQDTDERVFVTNFFAELDPSGSGEGFDNGKRALVTSFPAGTFAPVARTRITALADSGFTANRTNLCTKLNPLAVNDTFCPDTNAVAPNATITQDPQGVFPNQLASALIRGNRLYLPNIGAQPEPPVVFNTNVQALVHVVDTVGLSQIANLRVNLNSQIATEPDPSDITSLDKLFGNDIVAIDANEDGTQFYIVSRGGNFVLRATAANENSPLDIGAPDNVVRIQTGNIPSGIVLNSAGTRAYVNNEVNMSVSILNLQNNSTVELDVPSSNPPVPGTQAHSVLVGKLVFFTALGVPDNGLTGTPIRNLVPRLFRGKQSNNAWSTCASCHPSGLADGVTWIFPDGPRQAIPMDGLYSKINGAHDTRINNWSAARDSVSDFNANSRNVQCGTGFAGGATNPAAGCPPFGSGVVNPNTFDHGLSQGISEALDLETLWAQTIRSNRQPQPIGLNAGRTIFQANCASCHGGAKWTKSQVLFLNNPTLDKPFAAGGTARDPGLTVIANQIVSYADPKVDTGTLLFLENIGTFLAASPIEIRQNGQAPLGAAGFNVPSLLGLRSNAPYFHNGSAKNLDEVFAAHALPGGGTILTLLPSSNDRTALKRFLNAIDGRTLPLKSDGDLFKEPFSSLP